jgi:hypothetical protein
LSSGKIKNKKKITLLKKGKGILYQKHYLKFY